MKARRARDRAAGVAIAVLVAAAGLAARAPAQDLAPPDTSLVEPPPEVADGEDAEFERADSLAAGSVEVGYSATGRPGERARRSRRLRFSGEGFSGATREGTGDPLAGSAIATDALGGALSIGRLAPRWGRGLVIGAPGEPWARGASDRGEGARFVGRSGQGAWFRRAGPLGFETVAGRFARRDLAGGRLTLKGASLGVLAARGAARQWSLGVERGRGSGELALDDDGRWRAEAGVARAIGAWRLASHARGGVKGFRSLAEPLRSGPAQAAAVSVARGFGAARGSGLAALWRFAPGLTGARGALEVDLALAHHGALAVGFEEQQGVRRAPSAGGAPHAAGLTHGLWGEWRGGTPRATLALRHETWGEARLARRAVRTATAARFEAAGPLGARVAIAHTVYRVRRGGSLYLAEAEGERLILRSLSGEGERTRLECGAAAGGGFLRAALNVSAAGVATPRAQWVLDWTRRARTAGNRAPRGP